MILLHFFTREIRKKTYLMADSSASRGYEPLFQAPEVMFEIDGTESRDELAARAEKHIVAGHPTLRRVETLMPKRKRSVQLFDLVFEKTPEADAARAKPRKRGIIERIIGK